MGYTMVRQLLDFYLFWKPLCGTYNTTILLRFFFQKTKQNNNMFDPHMFDPQSDPPSPVWTSVKLSSAPLL